MSQNKEKMSLENANFWYYADFGVTPNPDPFIEIFEIFDFASFLVLQLISIWIESQLSINSEIFDLKVPIYDISLILPIFWTYRTGAINPSIFKFGQKYFTY